MTPKGQVGISDELKREFESTALNPVIMNAAGTLLHLIQLVIHLFVNLLVSGNFQ